MSADPVPTGPIDTMPKGFVPGAEQQKQLLSALAAAGVELGTYDQRIVEWVAGWDWSTVATITSWVKRAGDQPNP